MKRSPSDLVGPVHLGPMTREPLHHGHMAHARCNKQGALPILVNGVHRLPVPDQLGQRTQVALARRVVDRRPALTGPDMWIVDRCSPALLLSLAVLLLSLAAALLVASGSSAVCMACVCVRSVDWACG